MLLTRQTTPGRGCHRHPLNLSSLNRRRHESLSRRVFRVTGIQVLGSSTYSVILAQALGPGLARAGPMMTLMMSESTPRVPGHCRPGPRLLAGAGAHAQAVRRETQKVSGAATAAQRDE